MKWSIKRVIVFTLAWCLCLSSFCPNVWAAELDSEQNSDAVVSVEEEAAEESGSSEADVSEPAEFEVGEEAEESHDTEESADPQQEEQTEAQKVEEVSSDVEEPEEESGCEAEDSGETADESESEYAVEKEPEEVLSAQAVVASGTCGDNLTWTLDDSGTLMISGTGQMSDWKYDSLPWNECKGTIKKVIIQMGATSIGENAFYYCGSLTGITIPSSVTSIGNHAFGSCSSLTSITIPSSVTSIGECAFNDCSSLTNITIPSSVTSIGYFAFHYCYSLTSIVIPSSVTSIGDFAFDECNSLTNITIPSSVTNIGKYAFDGCSSLTSITIPSSMTSIGEGTFHVCSNLTSVTIPSSVTSIGHSAFLGCSSLSSITIPDSVTSIESNAFNNCPNLTIWGMAGSEAQKYASDNSVPFKEMIRIPSCSIILSPTSFTYDGNAKKPNVTVKNGSTVLSADSDYTVAYQKNVNAGTATVTVTGKDKYYDKASKTFTIAKAAPTLRFASTSISKKTTDGAFTNSLTKKTDGTISYSSSNTSVATVSSTGQVTIKGAGSATITATAAQGTNYNSGSVSYTLNVQGQSGGDTGGQPTDGGTITPATITASNITKKFSAKAQSFSLKAKTNSDAKLTYKSSDKKVKISKTGKVTLPKNYIGKFTVTIKTAKTSRYTAASKKITVTVTPPKAVLTTASSPKKGWIKLAWKTEKNVSSYQIQVCESKNFATGDSRQRAFPIKKKNATMDGLTSGKKYYARIRSVMKVGKKTYFGPWSGIKTVKIK